MLPDVYPIHVYAPFNRFQCAEDNISKSSLSRTGRPNQSSRFIFLNGKADVFENIGICIRIMKRHIPDFYLFFQRKRRFRFIGMDLTFFQFVNLLQIMIYRVNCRLIKHDNAQIICYPVNGGQQTKCCYREDRQSGHKINTVRSIQ